MNSGIEALFNSKRPRRPKKELGDERARGAFRDLLAESEAPSSAEKIEQTRSNKPMSKKSKYKKPKYKKPRYKVDLPGQMAECEANYFRLLKILPDFDNCNEWHFALGRGAAQVDVKITVTDRAPYTTTLKLIQQAVAAQPRSGVAHKQKTADSRSEPGGSAHLKSPVLTICLYHDAGMAEVVAWEHHRRLRPRYHYPNTNMYHIDEKAQCNNYLTEWLALCQEQGRAVVDMSDLGLPALSCK